MKKYKITVFVRIITLMLRYTVIKIIYRRYWHEKSKKVFPGLRAYSSNIIIGLQSDFQLSVI